MLQKIKSKAFLLKGMRLTSWLIALIGKILLAAIVIFLIINIFEVTNIKWDTNTNKTELNSIIIAHYENFKLSIILLLIGFVFIFLVRLIFKFFYFARDRLLYQFNQKKKIYIFRNIYNVYSLIAIIASFTAVIIAYIVISKNIQILFDSIQDIVNSPEVDSLSSDDVEKAFNDFVNNLRNTFLTNDWKIMVFYIAAGISGLDIIFMLIYLVVSLVSKFGKFDKNAILAQLSDPASKQVKNKKQLPLDNLKQPIDSTKTASLETLPITNDNFMENNEVSVGALFNQEQKYEKIETDLQPDHSEINDTVKADQIDFNNQRESIDNDNVWGASFQPPEENK